MRSVQGAVGTPARNDYGRQIHDELTEIKVISRNRNGIVFRKPFTFTKPSRAASALLGGNASGWTEWFDPQGRAIDVYRQAARQKAGQKGQTTPPAAREVSSPAEAGTTRPDGGVPYHLHSEGADAQGVYFPSAGKIIVLRGSRGRRPRPKPHRAPQDALVESGILKAGPHSVEFTRDHTFDTVSGATSVVLGGSRNGWQEWRTEDGKNLGHHRPSPLRSGTTSPAVSEQKYDPAEVVMTRSESKAQGVFNPDGTITVKAGSVGRNAIRQEHVDSQSELAGQGVILPGASHFTFLRDHTFPTPSAASSLDCGSNSNGWTDWKLKDGQALNVRRAPR